MPTTLTKRTPRVVFPLLTGLFLVAAGAIAADDKTQTLDGQGITFQAPASWKKEQPKGAMRRLQLSISPVEGDDQPAELYLVALDGDGGGVDANVTRWQKLFSDAENNPPKVDRKTVKGQNTDVNRVEIAGRYTPAAFPNAPKQAPRDHSRLLGAIVIAPSNSYFLRMVGPEKTVASAREGFDAMIKSIKVESK